LALENGVFTRARAREREREGGREGEGGSEGAGERRRGERERREREIESSSYHRLTLHKAEHRAEPSSAKAPGGQKNPRFGLFGSPRFVLPT